jgi:hypothetical protein
MLKIALTTGTIAAVLLATQMPASARICARYCQNGVCWTDCSKIPGQTRLTAKANVSTPTSQPQPGLRRTRGRR